MSQKQLRYRFVKPDIHVYLNQHTGPENGPFHVWIATEGLIRKAFLRRGRLDASMSFRFSSRYAAEFFYSVWKPEISFIYPENIPLGAPR